jgi:hypothetical protein
LKQDAPPPVEVKVPGGHRVHPAPNVPAVHWRAGERGVCSVCVGGGAGG